MKSALRDLNGAEKALARGEWEEWIAREELRTGELVELLREHRVLHREWDNADGLTAGERSSIGKLSDEMEDLRERLRVRHAAVQHALAKILAKRDEAQQRIQRGRALLNRYSPALDPTSAFLDRRS
jgi:hypothetical protein